MIEEQALVTRIDGKRVYVKSMQTSACQHCLQQGGCGTALYAKILPNREIALTSQIKLNTGDKVIVGIEESKLLKASLFIYLLPIVMMLATVGLYNGDDQTSALLGSISLLAGFFLIHTLQKRITLHFMTPPQIIKKS